MTRYSQCHENPKSHADFNYLVFFFAVCQGRNNGSGICCRFRPSGLLCCVTRLVFVNILMKCNAVKASWNFVTYCHFPKGLNPQLNHCGKLRACKEWNTCFMCSTLTKNETPVLYVVHSKNETPVLYAVHSQRMNHPFDI